MVLPSLKGPPESLGTAKHSRGPTDMNTLNISRIVARTDRYRAITTLSQARRNLTPIVKALKEEGYKITIKTMVDEWQRQHDIVQARRRARQIDYQSPRWHPTDGQIKTRLYPRLKGIALRNCPRSEQGANFTLAEASICDFDPKKRVWVLHVQGFYRYSSRAGSWFTRASWLAGHDPDQESGYFTRRIPGNITSVEEALDWLVPAEVKQALDEGRCVVRQGDVYLVQMKRTDNLKGLPRRHVWDAERRLVTHPEHAPIHCPFPVKAIPQRLLTGYGAD